MNPSLTLAVPVVVIVGAYLLGSLSPGYWLVRWRGGGDVRGYHTGSTGAHNAARVLGRGAGAAVLLLDVARGALAVAIARWLSAADWAPIAAALAVVCGQVWPVFLGFRGGRGLATALGAIYGLSPITGLATTLVLLGTWARVRKYDPAGMAAAGCAPLLALLFGATSWAVLGVTLLVLLVGFTHRGVLRAYLRRSRFEGAPGDLHVGER